MKIIVPIFIIVVLCSQCSAQKRCIEWKVRNVKTNYVQKGILDTDYYKPPKYLIGKCIQIQDSLLTLTDIRKNYVGSVLNDGFSDTIILEKRIFFKRREDDDFSRMYPGDELVECIQKDSDTCFASEAFLNLLEVKGNGVNAYLSSSGKYSKTKCVLFILKENKEAVLFSENDFLLLFLTNKQ
jgi:hypothetical protein